MGFFEGFEQGFILGGDFRDFGLFLEFEFGPEFGDVGAGGFSEFGELGFIFSYLLPHCFIELEFHLRDLQLQFIHHRLILLLPLSHLLHMPLLHLLHLLPMPFPQTRNFCLQLRNPQLQLRYLVPGCLLSIHPSLFNLPLQILNHLLIPRLQHIHLLPLLLLHLLLHRLHVPLKRLLLHLQLVPQLLYHLLHLPHTRLRVLLQQLNLPIQLQNLLLQLPDQHLLLLNHLISLHNNLIPARNLHIQTLDDGVPLGDKLLQFLNFGLKGGFSGSGVA